MCTDTMGGYICTCKPDYTGDPYDDGCTDINECDILDKPCGNYAVCENASPGYSCRCPQGFGADPDPKVACVQRDVNILCESNFDCTTNAECIDGQCFCQDGFEPQGSVCVDLDNCRMNPNLCGPFATCINTPGSFRCECEAGYIGTPPRVKCKAPCEDVKCGDHAYCKPDGDEAYCVCEEGWTYDPSDISKGCIDIDNCDSMYGPSGMCGTNAICTNTPGTYECSCPPGFSGDPQRECKQIDFCSRSNICGENSLCTNTRGSYECYCPDEMIPDPDPSIRCIAVVTCRTDEECPGNAICDADKRCYCPEPNIGNDCRHPCESMSCGPNAHCMLANGIAQCLCSEGYTGGTDCVDINECSGNPCPNGAICTNLPGTYTCQCPGGSSGDPYTSGCAKNQPISTCSDKNPCPAGERCIHDPYSGLRVCICGKGYIRDNKTEKCRDLNECSENVQAACGINALCKNLPGSYECQCPSGFNGNPYKSCEECNSPECQCQAPYKLVGGNCILAGCSEGEKCPKGAECISITGGVSYCACPKGFRTEADGSCYDIDECGENQNACGYGALCMNTPGSFECSCPHGQSGDPYRGPCVPAQIKCSSDGDCSSNEKCVQPGDCICSPPYFLDPVDGNKCKSPCERFFCGINAQCTPTDPPTCACIPGFKGDALKGCEPADECAKAPCAYGAQCSNQKGGYKCTCPRGLVGDPYKGGCILESGAVRSECRSNADCAKNLACVRGTCQSPCISLTCGINAVCEPENHVAWCKCRVGFVKGPNNECVSPCDDFKCGSGAMCIVSNNGPTCKCPPGENGNPFPGGNCVTDMCSATKPCSGSQVCINGRCKHRCDDVVCGVGAMCDGTTGKCACEPNFIGNPDYICMPRKYFEHLRVNCMHIFYFFSFYCTYINFFDFSFKFDTKFCTYNI